MIKKKIKYLTLKSLMFFIIFTGFLIPFSLYAEDGEEVKDIFFDYTYESKAVTGGGVKDLYGLIDLVKSLFSAIVPLILSLAVIYFLWSLAQYMLKDGEEKATAKTNMIWGIVILFVMVSIWGLVSILTTTIFG